jgi:hypothetical protein
MLSNGYNNIINYFPFLLPNIKRGCGETLPFPTLTDCLVYLHPCFQNGYANDIWSVDTIFFVKHLEGVKERDRIADKVQEIKDRRGRQKIGR